MKKYSFKGQDVESGKAFEINGKAYPWNWFDLATPEDLAEHGFTETTLPDKKPAAKTFAEKLADTGLTIEELKAALIDITEIKEALNAKTV